MHERAREYLDRVITEHAETPWALIAELERSEPMGWEWKEGFVPVPRQSDQPRNSPLFAPEDDSARRLRQQRQKKRDISRPKL